MRFRIILKNTSWWFGVHLGGSKKNCNSIFSHSCTSLCWSTDGKFQNHQYDYGNIICLQNPSLAMVASRARTLKGSPDQSYFIFEINVGKSRFRHITTLGRDPRTAILKISLVRVRSGQIAISSIDFQSI